MLYTDNFIQTDAVIILYMANRWNVDLMLLYFNATARRRSNENLLNKHDYLSFGLQIMINSEKKQ